MFGLKKAAMPTREQALPGRATEMPIVNRHFVTGRPIKGDFPGMEKVLFGMGCFWGAEKAFWNLPGVVATAVGYAGGYTPNADYREVCSGQTGHNEVVLVVYDPAKITFAALLKVFWESHDPTQGMRQGNDVGTQYRSAIYTTDPAQLPLVEASLAMYQQQLTAAGYGEITTEVKPLEEFYYAEPYHQQYLAKNPGGYCGIGGTGVSCPIGTGA